MVPDINIYTSQKSGSVSLYTHINADPSLFEPYPKWVANGSTMKWTSGIDLRNYPPEITLYDIFF